MFDLTGRKALVTGASKGIGAAIALGFAREGADVAVNYNSDAAGAEETAGLIRALGRRAFTVKADIGKPDEVFAMFREVKKEFGALDVLINIVPENPVRALAALGAGSTEDGQRVIVPEPDEPLEGGDELLLVAAPEVEDQLRELLLPG